MKTFLVTGGSGFIGSAIANYLVNTGAKVVVFDNNSPLEFIHMKAHLQGWNNHSRNWQDTVMSLLNTKGDLIVGNIKQSKLFHYIEKDFVTPKLIQRLEELVNGKV